jgi:hypothetical protein
LNIENFSGFVKNYLNFKQWAISHGYKEGLSIERINPDGNYCPENCEWITKSENSSRVTSGRDAKIHFLTEENIQLKNRIKELELLLR